MADQWQEQHYDFDEVVALDTKYIAEWNIGLDIKILFKTVGVIFTGKGSQ